MKSKVSVVIPCYNAEKYIMRCLKSVENQTCGMENLEVILINDASQDNTLAYLKVFKEKYSKNVYIIDFSRNRGISAARNAGMKIATGEYIFFLDSDDWIAENAIEKMFKKAEEYHCDLVECGYRSVRIEGTIATKRNGEDWYKDLRDIDNRKWYIVHMPKLAVWGRLWKKEFLINNGLWHNEDCYMSEDVILTGQAMFLLKDVYFINEQLYFYYINQESMSHSPCYNTEKNRNVAKASKQLLVELEKRDLLNVALKNYKDEMEWFFIGPSYWYVMENIYREIGYYAGVVKECFPDICNCKYLQILDATHEEWTRHLRR